MEHMEELTTFPKFTELAPELQRRIWEYHIGLTPRFLHTQVRTQLPPPAASQVSRAARAHAFSILGIQQAPAATTSFTVVTGGSRKTSLLLAGATRRLNESTANCGNCIVATTINPRWVSSKDMVIVASHPSTSRTRLPVQPSPVQLFQTPVNFTQIGIIVNTGNRFTPLAPWSTLLPTPSGSLFPTLDTIHLVFPLDETTASIMSMIHVGNLQFETKFIGRLVSTKGPYIVGKAMKNSQDVSFDQSPGGIAMVSSAHVLKSDCERWLQAQVVPGGRVPRVELSISYSQELPRRFKEQRDGVYPKYREVV